jgi:hypothetical protein
MSPHVGTGDAAREIRKLIEVVDRLAKSSEKIELLTKVLIGLTVVLIFLTIALIGFELSHIM